MLHKGQESFNLHSMTTWRHKWTHYLGVSSSLLCLVHCLAFPLLIVFFPAFTNIDLTVVDSFWEFVCVGLTIVSVITIIQVHKSHHRFSIALPLAFIGVVLLMLSLYLGHEVSTYSLPAGSVMILLAHVMNLKFCNDHKHCTHSALST